MELNLLTAQENQLQLRAIQLSVPRNNKETSKLGAQHHIDPVTANLQALKSSKSLKLSQIGPHWVDIGWVERVCWKLSVLNFDPSYSMGILLALEVLKLAVFQPALTRTATKAAPRLQISASGQLWAVQPQDIKKCRWPPAFRSSRWPNAHLSHPHFPTALLHLRHLSSKEFESFKNFHVLCTPLEVSTSFFPAEAIWDTFWTVVAPVALVLLCVAEPDCGKESIPFLTWHHHPRHD